jgi:hypothetical protein
VIRFADVGGEVFEERRAARSPAPAITAAANLASRQADALVVGADPGISEEGLACTKAICTYIYETYGRFPGTTDALHLMWVMQVHHIDTDYYDKFFGSGAYAPAHATHMATWHP